MTKHLVRRATSLACAMTCAAAFAAPARAATHYTLVDLGAWSVPARINRSHEIVGMAAGFTAQATWRDGAWTPIELPASIEFPQSASFAGINAAGKIVGSAPTGAGGLPQPLVVDADGTATVDVSDIQGCALSAINDRGTIMGSCLGNSTTFLVKDGIRTDIAPPQAGEIFVGQAMNRHNDVAGLLFRGGPTDVALYANGKWTTILSLPTESAQVSAMNDARHVVGTNIVVSGSTLIDECFFHDGRTVKYQVMDGCQPTGINNRDQVVGWYGGASTPSVAFFAEPGHAMTDLQSLVNDMPRHWTLRRAVGISDDGAIIGEAFSADDSTNHGFLLVPLAR